MSATATQGPVRVGDRLPGFDRLITQERVEAYAKAAGDFNPIHLDENFARNTRFGKRIAHGMLSLAFVAEMLASAFPGNWHRNGRLKVRFTSPVFPGETVSTYGEITGIRDTAGGQIVECSVGCRRPDGSDAVAGMAIVLTGD